MLLFIANLAGCPFHGLGLSDCDFLDGARTFVQTSAVAVGMVAFGLWAGTDIHHAALQRFKATKSRFKRHYVPFKVQYSGAAGKATGSQVLVSSL